MLDYLPRVQSNNRRVDTEGTPNQLGVTWLEDEHAYNFALYSRNAAAVTLLFYTEDDARNPVCQYCFDRYTNKTGPIWHCRLLLADLQGATLYAYRVEGPNAAGSGNRFDSEKVLLDPFAAAVFFPASYDRQACARPGPTDGLAPLARLPKAERLQDWDGARLSDGIPMTPSSTKSMSKGLLPDLTPA